MNSDPTEIDDSVHNTDCNEQKNFVIVEMKVLKKQVKNHLAILPPHVLSKITILNTTTVHEMLPLPSISALRVLFVT